MCDDIHFLGLMLWLGFAAGAIVAFAIAALNEIARRP